MATILVYLKTLVDLNVEFLKLVNQDVLKMATIKRWILCLFSEPGHLLVAWWLTVATSENVQDISILTKYGNDSGGKNESP